MSPVASILSGRGSARNQCKWQFSVQIRVQYGDSFGKEAVPECTCSGRYGPVAPARGLQVEEMEARSEVHRSEVTVVTEGQS